MLTNKHTTGRMTVRHRDGHQFVQSSRFANAIATISFSFSTLTKVKECTHPNTAQNHKDHCSFLQ